MSTHTYAVLEISPSAYAEIAAKLRQAEYTHAFQRDGGRELIDMHGIALAIEGPPAEQIAALAALILAAQTEMLRLQR